MDGSQGEFRHEAGALDPDIVRAFLREHPELLKGDEGLLAELGLMSAPTNVVQFAPLARVRAAHQREAEQRQLLEETAQANFLAQMQTQGAVVDLLDARNLADLSRRVDELARSRFGLAAGVIALESEGLPPAGWTRLVEGQVDLILDGRGRLARMGFAPTARGLFGEEAGEIASMALVRLSVWEPARCGLLAFGAADEGAFTPEMGTELVTFLARVVERTAERWPLL